MGGDLKTRKFHEQGRNHREALKNFLIETRKRKVIERRADEDRERILRQIDADAHRAMGGLAGAGGAGAGASAGGGMGAGASAAAAAGAGAGANARAADAPRADVWPADGESAEKTAAEDGVGDGIYDVDGAFFLMGEHESARALLVDGAAVEVLLSGSEEWEVAQVLAVRDAFVPFTMIVTRTVTVALPNGARVDLPAASLRFPLGDEASAAALRGPVVDARPDDDGADVEVLSPPVPVDEGTGLGQWATVVVEPARKRARAGDGSARVDDSAVARSSAGADAGADTGAGGHDLAHFHANPSKALDAAASVERRTNAALEAVDDDNRGDAFFTYNPYGGDTYKGIRLGAVVDPATAGAAQEGLAAATEQTGDATGWATVSAAAAAPAAASAIAAPVHAANAAPAVEFKARAMGGAGRAARKRLE